MKKFEKILVISIFILIGVYLFARFTNTVRFYRASTTSMEPNYAVNELLFVTNLVSAKKGSPVAYKSTSVEVPGVRPAAAGIFLARLIGAGGDQLEIKNGYAYINGVLVDKNINLKFYYITSDSIYRSNLGYFLNLPATDVLDMGNEKMMALEDTFFEKLPIKTQLRRFDASDFNNQTMLATTFQQKGWTTDNMGPVDIPKGYVFVLGDFRHNAEDSRIKGFIREKDIVGVVIN